MMSAHNEVICNGDHDDRSYIAATTFYMREAAYDHEQFHEQAQHVCVCMCMCVCVCVCV